MRNLTWGVDGFGRCFVLDAVTLEVVFCTTNSGAAYCFCEGYYG